MATKKKKIIFREEKPVVFAVLKAAAPTLFGSKVYTDVDFFGEDPQDTSKIIITCNEEVES